MRTIADVVPTPLLVLLVVGGVVGIVLLSVCAVRRFVPVTREGFGGPAVDSAPFREGVPAQFTAKSR